MTYFHLLQAGLARRRAQVIITAACIVIAFLLLGVLLSVRQGLAGTISLASLHRLRSHGAASDFESLPLSYADAISRTPGVQYVLYATATAAAYQDNPRHLLLQAIPAAHFLEAFPELHVSPQQWAVFTQDKQGLLAGPGALQAYGWKLGQTFTLRTNVLNKAGNGAWTVHLDAEYSSSDPGIPSDLVFIHYSYLNDFRILGKNQVISFIAVIADPSKAGEISRRIDTFFEASSPKLVTEPENVMAARQAANFNSLDRVLLLVGGLTFLSVLLLANNVWYERVDNRRAELAVLKALGFTPVKVAALVASEAVGLTIVCAAIGLLAAFTLVALTRLRVEVLLPSFGFPHWLAGVGLIVSLGFGLIASALPAASAARIPESALYRE